VPLEFMRVSLWVRGAVRTVGEPGAVTESRNGGGTGLQRRIGRNRYPSLATDHVTTESWSEPFPPPPLPTAPSSSSSTT